MTSEQIFEEIMHAAHERGIATEVLDLQKKILESDSTMDRVDSLVKAYYKVKQADIYNKEN